MSIIYTAVASSAGRDTRAVTSDGQLDVKLALQKEFGGDGDGTNPEQLFAAGYAACFASSMQIAARRRKLDITGAAATAEVGVNPNSQGGFTLTVTMRVELPDHVPSEPARELVDAAHHICPYSNAIRGNVPVSLTSSDRRRGRAATIWMVAIRPGLDGVPETALWTLRFRSLEARRAGGVLADPVAIELVKRSTGAPHTRFHSGWVRRGPSTPGTI